MSTLTTIKDIKAAIKTKLEGIQLNSEAVFGSVYDYPETKFDAWPAAVIRRAGSDGLVIDTGRNQRTFHFEVLLYQAQAEQAKNAEDSEGIMVNAEDAILTAFDEDKDLGGQVMRINVVSSTDTPTAVNQGAFNFAVFKIDAVVIVPNF